MADVVDAAEIPNPPIPWLQYERFHTMFNVGLPIVVGKSPLSERFSSVPEDKKFTFRMLRDSFRNLGLVINLTNNTEFYNPEEEFLNTDIDYYQVGIPTSGHVTEPQVEKYLSKLDSFLHSKDSIGKVVFIHSGFGHYRCDYMIRRCLTDLRGRDVKSALETFRACRPAPEFKNESKTDAKKRAGKEKLINRKVYRVGGKTCIVKEREDWWPKASDETTEKTQSVKDKEEDVTMEFSKMDVGKGKKLAPKSSRSSAVASMQGLDIEMGSQIVQTELRTIVDNSGGNLGWNVRAKLSRKQEEAMEYDETVDAGAQQPGTTGKKQRIED